MLTETELRSLLGRLASELGFCDIDEDDRALQTEDEEQFIQAVFRAEGFDAHWRTDDLCKQVRQRVHEAFTKHDDAQELADIMASLD